MDPILSLLISVVSLVFMRDYYEHLQDRRRRNMTLREQRVFSAYRLRLVVWLVVMQGVTLLLASVHPAAIFVILYFYANFLILAPQLLHQFFPDLNLR